MEMSLVDDPCWGLDRDTACPLVLLDLSVVFYTTDLGIITDIDCAVYVKNRKYCNTVEQYNTAVLANQLTFCGRINLSLHW